MAVLKHKYSMSNYKVLGLQHGVLNENREKM